MSKGVATLVGSRLATYRTGLAWGTVWTVAGTLSALLISAALMRTFSTGLVTGPFATSARFPIAVAAGACAWVLLASYTGLPVSTTHSLTGAIVGAATAAAGASGVRWAVAVRTIAAPLAFSPLAAGGLAYLVHAAASRRLSAASRYCVCVREKPFVLVPEPWAESVATARAVIFPLIIVDEARACSAADPLRSLRITDAMHWLSPRGRSQRTRSQVFAWTAVVVLLVCAMSAKGQTKTFRHDLWDRVLQTYVTPGGLFHYAALKAHPDELNAYIDSLTKDSPDSSPQMFPTQAHRLAYWINAYNAEIMNRVIQHYPVRSIRDLGGTFSSVFKRTQTVGGKSLSHDDIEHNILRKRFHEPRIHFVLNCASRCCAPLRRHAFTAENLEESLQEATVTFLNEPRNVRIHAEAGTVELSKYFDWFPGDFLSRLKDAKGMQRPTVLDFVRSYLQPEKRALLERRSNWRVTFFDYDWRLNDADSPTVPARN